MNISELKCGKVKDLFLCILEHWYLRNFFSRTKSLENFFSIAPLNVSSFLFPNLFSFNLITQHTCPHSSSKCQKLCNSIDVAAPRRKLNFNQLGRTQNENNLQ